jgi:hypothetical protein
VTARIFALEFQGQVSDVVRYLLEMGYNIYSGGAFGADMYALETVLGYGAYSRAVIFSAWSSVVGFPRIIQPLIERYKQHSGKISWGLVQPYDGRQQVVRGLLSRNRRLVSSVVGLVAFLYGESRGTTSTVLEAIKRDIKAVVFDCGGGSILPDISGGKWHRLRCSGCFCGAYSWRLD